MQIGGDKHSSQREQALQKLWGGRMFDIPEGKREPPVHRVEWARERVEVGGACQWDLVSHREDCL